MSQTKKRILLATAVAALAIAVTVGLLVHWYVVPRLSEEWQSAIVSIAGAVLAAAAFVRAIPGVIGTSFKDLLSPTEAQSGRGSATLATASEFVGRENEIKRLVDLVRPGKRVPIVAVTGMGGVGKTELAKVVAARVARRFGDGVLWAECGKQDLPAIADLWAGVWGEHLTGDDEEGKAAAWRALVGGREALLVFDDVQPGQVVESLFPAQGRSAVLITSRDGQQPALRGAERLVLEQFTEREAMDLARAVLGKSPAEAQANEAGQFFCLVGYLPLGVSVGLHLARECGWDLATLNERLEVVGAVPVLGDDDRLRTSLNATFEAAWESLGPLQPTFAALALFGEGTSFDTAAAAAVLGVEETEAGARLAQLAARSLLSRAGGGPVLAVGDGQVLSAREGCARNAYEGRWTLHTLLRAIVAGNSLLDEGARARMAGHYARVLRAADELYLQGGEGVRRGLSLFDLELPHIRACQAWAAEQWEENEEAARWCSAYPDAGVYCLSLRLRARERIEWLEAAAGAARCLGNRAAEGRHLGNLGLAYAALGDARRAIQHYEEALGIAREICAASTEGSPEWTAGRRAEGDSLGSLGNAYAALGEPQRAVEHYEQALAIARAICASSTEGSPEWTAGRRGEGNRLANLGLAYADLGDVQRAIDYQEQALAIAREIGHRRGEGNSLGSLGLAYAALGEAQRAIEYVEQALAIARELGDRRNEGIHLGNLGNAYADLGDGRRAIECYEQALDIAREIEDRKGEENRLGNLGLAHWHSRETRRAIEYYEQALAIAREIGNRQGEESHLGNLGIAYGDLGEAWRAIDYYEHALATAREIGAASPQGSPAWTAARRGEGNHWGNLGLAYANLGEAEVATTYYEQALAISREIGDRTGEGNRLGSLGLAYAALGDTGAAIEYLEQALTIAREICAASTEGSPEWTEGRRNEGSYLNNLGLAYADLGKARQAIDYFEQSLAIARESGDRHGEANRLASLGNAYYILGEARRAIEYYGETLAIVREIGAASTAGAPEWMEGRREEGNHLGNLGNAYYVLGEARRAIEHYEGALAIAREIRATSTEGSPEWSESRRNEGVRLGNLGNAYADLAEARRAVKCYLQALAIRREICAASTAGSPEWMAGRRGEGADLGSLGLAYAALGDARRAIEHYEGALAIAREIGNRQGEERHLGNLGLAYADLGEARRAIDCFEEALAIAREIGDRQGEGSYLGNLGDAYAVLGDASQAIEYYEQALAISRELGDRRGEVSHLGNLGIACADLGEARRAIEHYEAALAIAREIRAAATEGSPEWTDGRRWEGNQLGNLGNAYYVLGEPQPAIEYYEQALAISREIGDRRGEGNHLGNLGLAYADLGEAKQAIEYYEEALAISRASGDQQGEGAHLNNLGLSYAALGEARRAIECYEGALAIAREIRAASTAGSPEWTEGRRNEGAHLGILGLSYADLGEARRAIEYYEQALAIARELGDQQGEASRLGNLGNAYADLGEAQRAIEYYQGALAVAREIRAACTEGSPQWTEARRGEGNHLGSLGLVHADLGEVLQATEYFEQALAIAQGLGDRRNQEIYQGNLGLAYAALGELWRATEHFEEALAISRENGDRWAEGNSLGNLGDAYAVLGDASQAIEYYEQALAISREVGDRQGEGNRLGNLGLACAALGESRQAIKYYQEALAVAREICEASAEGSPEWTEGRRAEGNRLGMLGLAYAEMGEAARAIEHYEGALAIAREIGDRRGQGNHLNNLGIAYAGLGKIRRAIEYYEGALGIAREIGDRQAEGNRSWNLGLLFEESDPTRAAELMAVRVEHEKEIGHPDAEAHAQQVAQIGARAGKAGRRAAKARDKS